MGVFSGPEILTDGLVLYFDETNVNKSWKGKPTTNLAPYTDYSNRNFNTAYVASSWDTDYATIYYYQDGGYNNLPYKKMVKTAGGGGGSFFNDHSYFTLEEGKTYIISCYMKANQPTTVSGHTLALNRDSDNAYRVPADFSVTTNWERKQWTYTCGVGEGGTTYHFRQIVYNDAGLPLEVYWSGMQIEEGILPSAYVNGTRANTQSVVDLSNRSTITANSLTYASDGTFSFNGVDNYISTSRIPFIGNATSSITWGVWVKPTGTSGNIVSMSSESPQSGWNMPPLAATGQKFRGKIWSNNYLYSQSTYTLNTWYYVVLVFDASAGAQRLYVNGILQDSQTGISYSSSGVDNYLFFGQQNPGADNTGMFAGEISNVQVYTNKALTNSEIQLNFNALRGRYGI